MLYEVITITKMVKVNRHRQTARNSVKKNSQAGKTLKFVEFLIDNNRGCRITSYNVCYTKLLRGDSCILYLYPAISLPRASFVTNALGASLRSSSFARKGRMDACGQTNEHWLHMMQFSGIHSGTFTAIPRFSNWVVPVGKKPRGSNRNNFV